MTNQDLRKDTELLRLAEILHGRPMGDDAYKGDLLLTGLDAERKRLGQRKYLVLLIRQEFDIDGMEDYIFLQDAFDSESEAVEFAKSSAASLCKEQVSEPHEYGKEWRLVSTGERPYISEPKSLADAPNLQVVHESTYRVKAWEYNSMYNCFRAIGPLSGDVVSDELFSFVDQRQELWSYFLRVGGNIVKATPPRQQRTNEHNEKVLEEKRRRQKIANREASRAEARKMVQALREKRL